MILKGSSQDEIEKQAKKLFTALGTYRYSIKNNIGTITCHTKNTSAYSVVLFTMKNKAGRKTASNPAHAGMKFQMIGLARNAAR